MKIVVDGRTRYLGRWRAFIIDREDPLLLGRLKLSIPDVMGEVDSVWALPAMGTAFKVPKGNVMVWVEFEQGDPMKPVWTGWFHSAPDGDLPPPNAAIGKDDETTYPPRGLDAAATASGKTIQEPAPGYDAEYGGIETNGSGTGIKIEKDETPGKERVAVYHPSGTVIEIVNDGSIRIRGMKLNQVVRRDLTSHVGGKEITVIEEGKEERVVKDCILEIGGDDTITIKGKRIVNVKAEDQVNVEGSRIEVIGGGLKTQIGGALIENTVGARNIGIGGAEQRVVMETASEVIMNLYNKPIGKQVMAVLGSIMLQAVAGSVYVDGLSVRLGGLSAIEPVPLGNILMSWLNTHTHSNGNNGSPTGTVIIPIQPELALTKRIFVSGI